METTPDCDLTKDKERRPIARFLSAPRNLASAVYGAFIRDTRGCDLNLDTRLNHYSASPLCVISWCFEGKYSLLETGRRYESLATPTAAIAFSGPQSKPMTSINHGPVYAMMVAIYPDAFARITGLNIRHFMDRTLPAEDVFSDELMVTLNAILKSYDAEKGYEMLNQYLAPKWQEQRAKSPQVLGAISDWTLALVSRAPQVGIGRSIRQIERRIKNWTGQSRRDLEFFSRNETSFALASKALQEGDLNAADVALQSGFSDQSHLGRSVKRQTGHSPKDLLWHIENDEAYWSYRLIAGMEMEADNAR